MHPGHLYILQKAAKLGDKLIVGVQDDESVRIQKGKGPIMTCSERVQILEALPYVSECRVYHDIDQRKMINDIKPNIMAQTEEWVAHTDRSLIIEHLRKRRIRLVLFAIDKTISSSDIKRRVIDQLNNLRNDTAYIKKILKIIPINSLSIYEKPDRKRVTKLISKISEDKHFRDPILVAKYNNKKIVIDGTNRLEALKKLGTHAVLAQVVNYDDKDSVELRNNIHFLKMKGSHFLSVLESNNIVYKQIEKSHLLRQMENNQMICWFQIDDKFYALLSNENKSALNLINRFVKAYKNIADIYRLSELSQENEMFPIKIIFPRFSIDDIFRIVVENKYIESGVTWHKIKNIFVRFNIPINILINHQEQAEYDAWLLKKINKSILNKNFRYYPSTVYICDEWS